MQNSSIRSGGKRGYHELGISVLSTSFNNIDLELIKSYDYTAVLNRPELTKVRALFDSVIH